MSYCKKCNGAMVGDGYSSVMHCEYASEEDYAYHESDSNPVYCDFKEVAEHKADLEAVTTWHSAFISIDADGVITAWDESHVYVIHDDCLSVAKAIKILDGHAIARGI